MYEETYDFGDPANATHARVINLLANLSGSHGLRLNGLDLADPNTHQTFSDHYHQNNHPQVYISVDNPDAKKAEDIAELAKLILDRGGDPWGKTDEHGQPLFPPVQYWEQAAELSRRSRGYKQSSISTLNHEMSLDNALSKWKVVALGELQQPGGVGATQGYNPVIDGPNPDSPPSVDNANNSPEQEVALQTWVNTAVDLLNRGKSQEEVIAILAHEGCHNPEQIVARALQQPDQSPVSDTIGQDPFEAPPSQDATMTGQMEGLSQQPQVMGRRVRIANTSQLGTETDRYLDTWGEEMSRIALDGGGSLNVSPTAIEYVNDESKDHPVSEIQEFINGLPEVEPTRPSIEAAIANYELVRRACSEWMPKVGFHDQVKLEGFYREATVALGECNNALYNLPDFIVNKQYRIDGLSLSKVDPDKVPTFTGNVKEAARIWVNDTDLLGYPVRAIREAAEFYTSNFNFTEAQTEEFIKAATDLAQPVDPNQIHAAKQWLLDCFSDPADAQYISSMGDKETISSVNRHYQGGWQAFTQDAQHHNPGQVENDGPAEQLFG